MKILISIIHTSDELHIMINLVCNNWDRQYTVYRKTSVGENFCVLSGKSLFAVNFHCSSFVDLYC